MCAWYKSLILLVACAQKRAFFLEPGNKGVVSFLGEKNGHASVRETEKTNLRKLRLNPMKTFECKRCEMFEQKLKMTFESISVRKQSLDLVIKSPYFKTQNACTQQLKRLNRVEIIALQTMWRCAQSQTETKRSPVKMDPTCGHFPWTPAERAGAAAGGNIATEESNIVFYRPVRSSSPPRPHLLRAFPPRRPLSQRFWRFALPCFLSVQQKEPDRSNEWTKTAKLPASPQKKRHSRTHARTQATPPFCAKKNTTRRERRPQQKETRKKCGEGSSKKEKGNSLSVFFFFFPFFFKAGTRAEFLQMEKIGPRRKWDAGEQRPSPLMNGRRGFDVTTSASQPITSPGIQRAKSGGSWGGWGLWVGGCTVVTDNGGDTTTWPTTCLPLTPHCTKFLYNGALKTTCRCAMTLILNRRMFPPPQTAAPPALRGNAVFRNLCFLQE